MDWSPENRLIVAQAQAEGVSLVTADKLIRKHYARALWGKKRRYEGDWAEF